MMDHALEEGKHEASMNHEDEMRWIESGVLIK
jgi:hypothetical protein